MSLCLYVIFSTEFSQPLKRPYGSQHRAFYQGNFTWGPFTAQTIVAPTNIQIIRATQILAVPSFKA